MPSKLKPIAIAVNLVIALPAIANEQDIEHITVSGSQYSLMSQQSGSSQFLTKEAIDKMPHIADDIFRLMPALPGVTAGDFSANFFVRGGEVNEVLVMLDGQQLYRPFHMKSFNGAFSILDTENVGAMSFSSGGYSAKYGHKMSGLLDLQSLYPQDETEYSMGVSFINARAGGQGSFAEGRGRWLASARRGYLDLVLKAVDDESSKFEPTFGDVYSKISYQLNPKHEISFNMLYAYDDEILDDKFDEPDGRKVIEKISGKYASQYFWSQLHSEWNQDLTSSTLLSAALVEEDRRGGEYDPLDIWLSLDDNRDASIFEVKQDWQWRQSDNQLLQFGFYAKSLDVDYRYDMEAWYAHPYNGEDHVKRNAKIKREGNEAGVYLNHKFRWHPQWISEAGVRWDQQDYMGFDDDQLSPRLSLAYLHDKAHQLRLSWGHYFQPQDILGLQVADGVNEFSKAQKAEHLILGYQGQWRTDMNLRVELYQKKLSEIRPRFENLFDMFPLFPEGQADRELVAPSSAKVQGLEVSFQHQLSDKIQWSANYVYSKAEDEINGQQVPRSWDQPHAVNVSFNYLFDNGWNLHLAGVYHSGWPTTGETAIREQQADGSYRFIRQLQPRNQLRLGAYSRIDLRAAKTYQYPQSELTWFVEVSNLLNQDNECCVEERVYKVDDQGNVAVTQDRGNWLPIIPSVGVQWRF